MNLSLGGKNDYIVRTENNSILFTFDSKHFYGLSLFKSWKIIPLIHDYFLILFKKFRYKNVIKINYPDWIVMFCSSNLKFDLRCTSAWLSACQRASNWLNVHQPNPTSSRSYRKLIWNYKFQHIDCWLRSHPRRLKSPRVLLSSEFNYFGIYFRH